MRGNARSLVIAAVAAALVAGAAIPAWAPGKPPPTCTLTPALRATTVTQGVAAYARLARGKETLVRLHLSLPSCATTGQTIQLVGGTLGVSGGGSSITVANPTPVPASPYPQIVPYSLGPANDSPGDPMFVVPGSSMRPPGATGSFVITFTPTVRYVTSSSATPATVSLGSFTASVEKKTNAIRLLVIPMGDASKTYDSQFSVAARQAVQDGMQVVSRILPIPDGVTELKPPTGQQASGGLRYTIDPGMLDLGPRGANVLRADGKLCGSATNFTTIKDRLSQYLQSWNTANSSYPADRVLGVIDTAIADGGCVLGMASTTGNQSWVIAFPDAPGAPSKTGGIAVQELGHTMGLVPAARDATSDVSHSPVTEADAGSNRAYNVPLRLFLSNDRTVMKYTDASYNNVNDLLERDDWSLVQCRLGGQTSTECSTAGTVGSSLGVGADQTFVMTGKTDGTPANTTVFESFFAAGTPRTVLQDPASPFALYQKLGNVLRRRDQVDVSFVKTEHSDSGSSTGSIIGDFSFAVPFDSAADRIEFVKETANGPVVLHSIDRSLPPVFNNTTSTFGAGDPPLGQLHNFTDDPSTDDVQPSLTGNGRWIAWAAGSAGARRIFVAPVSNRDAKVMMPAPGGGDFADPAFRNDGGALAFILDGDLYTVPVTLTGSSASFGSRTRIRDAGGTVANAHHPTWSPNGAEIAFDDGDDIFKRAANGTGSDVALAVTSAVERSPSWSREASDNRIAYVIEGTTMTAAASISLLSTSVANDEVAAIKWFSQQLGTAGAGVLTASAALPAPTVTGTVGTPYTVNSNDDSDDGACDGTHCSLREAINAANTNTGKDTILFAIAGAGPHTIAPTAQLPSITDPADVTATCNGGVPTVEIDGRGIPSSAFGMRVTAGNSNISGLAIYGFAQEGIRLETNGGDSLSCSYLGLDVAGTQGLGNFTGVRITGITGVVIGGIGDVGNVISGNSTDVRIEGGGGHTVLGNIIGPDPTGTTDIGPGQTSIGIVISGGSTNNLVGGTSAGAGNVVSGHERGILIVSASNQVQGNYIGTNAAGTAAIPNKVAGIEISGANNNSIGGTTAGARNVISGNTSSVPNDSGIRIGGGAVGTVVKGNYIGVNAAGTAALGNSRGIEINGGEGSIIGGATPAERNIISGNAWGIQIANPGSTGSVVQGNYIGTDPTGMTTVQNNIGIDLASTSGNRVGGALAGEGNLISGNLTGVSIQGLPTGAQTGNVVSGNLIGTNASGFGALGNIEGVFIASERNLIGGSAEAEANTIAFNSGIGVRVVACSSGCPTGGGRNRIEFNRIHSNGGLGIDLGGDGVTLNDDGDADSGPNDLQNFPVLGNVSTDDGSGSCGAWTACTHIVATLDSKPSSTYHIEYFSNDACDSSGHGEGKTLIGSATINTNGSGAGGGDHAFNFELPPGAVVTATATDSSGNTSEFSACKAPSAPPPRAELSVSMQDSPDPVPHGNQLTYTITVSNAGPDTAADVDITDVLPGTVTLVSKQSSQGSCSGTATLTCSLGSIAKDASATITIVVTADQVGSVSNTASVSASTADTNSTDDQATASTTVRPRAELFVTLGDAPDPVVQHQQLTYTINVSNAGPDDAAGVTVSDHLPNQVSFESSSTTQGTCSGTTNFSCNLGAIAAEGSATVTVTVTANTLGTVTNAASVSATSSDTNSTDDEATTTTEVQQPTTTPTTDIYRLNPANPSQAPQLLALNGDVPAYGNGAVAFNRGGDVWRVSPDGSGLKQLTSGSLAGAPALTKSTLAFENTIFEEGCSGTCSSQLDIMLVTLTQRITSTITDANPGSGTFDVFLDCGDGVLYPLAVGLKPTTTSSNQATLDYTFDPSLSCAGGTIKIAYSDGFSRVTSDTAGAVPADAPPKDPVAEIYGPLIGQQVNQFGLLALSGSGVDPEDGKLPDSSFQWFLIPPGSTTPIALGSGSSLDKSPPAGGWPEGDATVVLKVTDSAGNVTTTSTPITFLRDADNDGIPAITENSQPCLGSGGDSSAANGFGDGDADGIPNYADQSRYGTSGPCSPQALYQAAATFDPQTLNTSSSGTQVTMYVRNLPRDLTQINAATVRLTEVGGFAVPSGQLIAQGWSIITETGAKVGVAKFDRQKLSQFITAHGITSGRIAIRIEGASQTGVSPAWRFFGIDTTQVSQ